MSHLYTSQGTLTSSSLHMDIHHSYLLLPILKSRAIKNKAFCKLLQCITSYNTNFIFIIHTATNSKYGT
ncbi:hypothetical protein EB796_008469 [Bugula neritina]|uniref:Uncharacterized protein n=1 Tax=Bugula neritina TaxID=10212 RepID=A0A7J7K5Q7_BUGNE|nr:hypothetical protein EB796_008469 [Bugula neritina]